MLRLGKCLDITPSIEERSKVARRGHETRREKREQRDRVKSDFAAFLSVASPRLLPPPEQRDEAATAA